MTIYRPRTFEFIGESILDSWTCLVTVIDGDPKLKQNEKMAVAHSAIAS
jgi:hypothetical protein